MIKKRTIATVAGLRIREAGEGTAESRTIEGYALKFGGRFAMVHLPERLGEIIVAMHENQMEPKRLRMVQPKEGRAPNMMLIEAVVGAAPGGLKVMPPLIVHREDGSYTEEILAIYGMQDAGENK